MNLIKYAVAFVMLTLLSACGGGGGSPGTSSACTSATLFTTAPTSLTLTSGTTSLGYNINCGVSPYTASSDTPSLISVSLSGSAFTLSAAAASSGSGSVSIIDSQGVKVTVSVTVPAPSTLFSNAPANLTLAIGTSSSAYSVTGGTAPYSVTSANPGLVSASIPTGSNFLVITALPGTTGGAANIVVSDSKGVQLTIAVTVSPPVGLYVDAPANLTIAAGAPGNTYTISGGAAPYTAVSSNTAVATSTTPASNGRFVIQGVSAGNASVTIKDAAGTTLTISVTVPAPTALFSTAPATLQILNGTTNFYTVFGGTPPYVVNTNGVIARAVLSGASLAISGVVPGVQTVAVSDATGAVITIDVTVKNGLYTDAPANLSVASGTGATYSIYGGIPYSGAALYRVNSSNPAVASATVTGSTLSINGLSTGSTSLVISDSVGATTSIAVTVPVAGALLTTAPSPLNLATGTSGLYAISGGVGPYTATSANRALVIASASGSILTIGAVADTVGGTANVVVTDSVGTPPLTIVVTAALVQFFTTAPSQLAIAAGSSKIFAVFGGSLPYTVVNTHPAVATGSITGSVLTITGAVAGSGTVIVSDAKGVSVSIAVAVNTPGPLNVSAPGATVTITSGGSNTFDIIGGVPPYLSSSSDLTIARATIVNANQIRVDALGAGNATVAVTDSAGTKVSVGVTVPGASNLVLYTTAPTTGVFLASADVVAYAIFGGVPSYSVQSSNESVVRATYTGVGFVLQAIAAGTAQVFVKDSSGLSVTIPVTVGSSNAFFVAAPATLNMGAGTTSPTPYRVSGGATPYTANSSDSRVATVVLDPVSSLLTINAFSVGTANLTISDALGKSYTITVVVDNAGGTGPSAATSIDILASGNSVNSAPGSTISFIVTVKDRLNTTMPKQTVAFSSSSGTLTGANPSPITDAAGTISTVTLSPGADASNRNITVTVATGSISKSIVIPVVGTTLSVSGPGAALVGSAPQNFTLKAVDSSGKPIVGASLAIASTLGNGLSPQSVVTDISGAGTVAFTAANVGTDTLTVTGLGASGTATVTVSNVDFSFTAPAAASLLPVNAATPVAVLYRVGGVGVAGQTVTFSSTRGTLSATTAVTSDGLAPGSVLGQATVNVSSTTSGPVTVSAQLGTARSSLTAAFVATVPATVVLQANPAAVLPNAIGSTTNQSALTAVVRDATGNPVQDIVVNFSAVVDGSNGSIAPGSVTTDANGMATSQFIAGPLSTPANGVQIKATVQQNTSISNTTVLTVNGQAQYISIGRSGTLTVFDSTTYQKDFSVYVTDANGAPSGNRAVTLSVWPTTYGKGSLVYNIAAGLWGYVLGSPTRCVNEDANRNGILDLGEDINGDGILQPGIPAVITSSVTTDALGFATFTLRYGKNFAWWVSTEITAKSLVGGTESKQIQSYDLEMTIDDTKAPGSPANVVSPFGTASVCTNPL